jgi:hypothetical protein
MARYFFLAFLFVTSVPGNAQPDLNVWNELLVEAVSDGVVDYGQWRKNPQFEQLVAQIATANTENMSHKEKLVFYINAYNILAARGILDNSSPSSVLGRYVYFKRDKYHVAGTKMNLHDLEHALIRPLKEPRIHFAIVCASQSCPKLRSEAYTLEKLDEQLDLAAHGFINEPLRNYFDAQEGVAEISRIFEWFEEDFTNQSTSLQEYLANYTQDPDVTALLNQNKFKIKHMKYDWNLNGTLDN